MDFILNRYRCYLAQILKELNCHLKIQLKVKACIFFVHETGFENEIDLNMILKHKSFKRSKIDQKLSGKKYLADAFVLRKKKTD